MRLLKSTVFAVFAVLFLLACNQKSEQAGNDPYWIQGESHLKNLRMLTSEGENAEAYFSFGNDKLIFQSTSGAYNCDQIFMMNLNGEDVKLVSTGKGRTTCSFFLPGDSTLIYASTHLASEECPPVPDRSRGYVWQLYDSYDIFEADLEGNIIRQLTDSPGYDAEAVVSPLGDKIVFTSTRDGDPEIYTMNLDGSNQVRLTHAKGYDGGPFFSPDGKHIVFRASRPQTEEELADYEDLVKNGYVRPTTLELFIMDADGKNMRQITNFGKASFAPYFHPDGKRIIFSSNVESESGRNFSLHMVNIDGTGLERITFNDTFDGFPMFSRDGKYLVFCSNRFNKKRGDTNVFIAEWVD